MINKTNRLTWCTGLLSLFICTPNFALNLQQIYALALEQDANYAQARDIYASAKLNLPIVKTAKNTQITAAGNLNHNRDNIDIDGADSVSQNSRQLQLGLDLQRNLYSKSITHDIQSAHITHNIAKLQLNIAKQTLAASTVELYLLVLAAQDNKALTILEQTALKKQLELATERLNVGLGTRTDLYDAKARFESSTAEVIAAQNNIFNTKQSLETLIGQPFSINIAEYNQTFDNQKIDLDINESETWITKALNQNLAYEIVRQQALLQKINTERTHEIRSPIIDFVAGTSLSDSGRSLQSSGGSQQRLNIGIQASIPLYNGGAIQLRQQKAGHDLNAAKAASEQSKRETERNLRSARRRVTALQEQSLALNQAVRANQSALNAKQEGFKAGLTTNLDVLNGQRDLFGARRNAIIAGYDVINALVNLKSLAGNLTEKDIIQIDSWLTQKP